MSMFIAEIRACVSVFVLGCVCECVWVCLCACVSVRAWSVPFQANLISSLVEFNSIDWPTNPPLLLPLQLFLVSSGSKFFSKFYNCRCLSDISFFLSQLRHCLELRLSGWCSYLFLFSSRSECVCVCVWRCTWVWVSVFGKGCVHRCANGPGNS